MRQHQAHISPDTMAADMPDRDYGARTLFWLSTTLLIASQVFGNGPDGLAATMIAQMALSLLSLVLIACCAIVPRSRRFAHVDRFMAALIFGIALLAIIQLVPLPPDIWTSLAGRSALGAEMHSIGVNIGWRSISFSPVATERSPLSLLPAIAIFVAARCMHATDRMRLIRIAVAFGFVSALLGIVQISGGTDSGFRPYRPSNLSDAVGFFSNRNHYGSMLAMLLPLSVGWVIDKFRNRRLGVAGMMPALLLCYTTFLLVIGILLSHSRAALLLTAIAGAGSVVLLWLSGGIRKRTVGIVGICGILVGVLALQLAGNGVVARFAALDAGADARWAIQDTTIAAAHRYGFFGSGLGTFVNAYQSVMPDEQPDQMTYVNHANDDYLELWLEAGWPGIVLVAGFFLWFAWVAIPLWLSKPQPGLPSIIARAASISILIALIDAALEYQLRKPGIMVLFGICCALLSANGRSSKLPHANFPVSADARAGQGIDNTTVPSQFMPKRP